MNHPVQSGKIVPLLSKLSELQKWRSPEYYENNVHKMQLPFSNKLLGSTLTSEEKQERRQQQLRRLQELNARRREEKLQLDQERLDRLLYVQVTMADFWVVIWEKCRLLSELYPKVLCHCKGAVTVLGIF